MRLFLKENDKYFRYRYNFTLISAYDKNSKTRCFKMILTLRPKDRSRHYAHIVLQDKFRKKVKKDIAKNVYVRS